MKKTIKNEKNKSQQNKKVLAETILTEEKPEPSLSDKLKEKKKLQKKKNIKRGSLLAFLVFFILFLYWGFMPFQGTVAYAMCKIVIELSIPYPSSLGFTEATELRNGDIRIWFTHIDAFGAFRQEPFLCSFSLNEETNEPYLSKARWGNVDLDKRQIDTFNKVFPYLITGEYYDTTYPAPLPDSIEDMQLNVDQYRKVNLMDLVTGKQ